MCQLGPGRSAQIQRLSMNRVDNVCRRVGGIVTDQTQSEKDRHGQNGERQQIGSESPVVDHFSSATDLSQNTTPDWLGLTHHERNTTMRKFTRRDLIKHVKSSITSSRMRSSPGTATRCLAAENCAVGRGGQNRETSYSITIAFEFPSRREYAAKNGVNPGQSLPVIPIMRANWRLFHQLDRNPIP